jgi:hypothetical protein
MTFTPTAHGARTATVSIADNAANSPQSIALGGTGIAPVAGLSPSSLTFPGQFVGTSGLPQNITLTNNGDASLTISSVVATTDFGATNGCTTSLAAGVGCTISVFFDPAAPGTRTGMLIVTDSAPGSPHTIALSGAGMDFALATTTSPTIISGQTATYSVLVTPRGGLNQTVNLTCSGAPTLATCTITPSSLPLNGTTSSTATVNVSTTAGTMAPPMGKTLPPGINGFGRILWLYALILASLALLAGVRKRRAYLLAWCLTMLLLWSACGGGGGGPVVHLPGTPAGSYTLNVNATVTSAATSTMLTHSIPLTLTVD